ncbi:hypothetical protein EMPS_00822 [Entomortierella parvispora]|uniref:Alpha/beta hydrolase fold-3 domain-containing protein n=1 Tax=Entomortierella parvispora TaxID=205924 RepID=A0A9P3H1M9_9FUNG|nr:hypothetical protein EMPS_00822 [Entomortierella parvispora]
MDYLPRPPKKDHKFNPIRFYCSSSSSSPETNVNFKALAQHPYISPLWGNLGGLPPMLIQCGEAERLRDECILFTHKAGGGQLGPTSPNLPKLSTLSTESQPCSQTPQPQQPHLGFDPQPSLTPTEPATITRKKVSLPVELDMYPGMVHVFQAIPFLPDASLALQRMYEFLERKESETDDKNETDIREP